MRVKTFFGAALCACVMLSCLVGGPCVNIGARAAAPNAIRETPPAPTFTEEERVGELRARRARVAERIGKNSVLVMFSAEPRVYTNDVDYEFRQENNLYYLTNLRQQGATFVMLPGATEGPREILFLPRRNPAAETWTGHMYSPEEARAASGVEEIWDVKEFEPFMRALRTRRAYRPQKEAILASTFNLPAMPLPAPGPPQPPQPLPPSPLRGDEPVRGFALPTASGRREQSRVQAGAGVRLHLGKGGDGLERAYVMAYLRGYEDEEVSFGDSSHAARDRHKHRRASARAGRRLAHAVGIRDRGGD